MGHALPPCLRVLLTARLDPAKPTLNVGSSPAAPNRTSRCNLAGPVRPPRSTGRQHRDINAGYVGQVMARVRRRLLSSIAGQLGRPHGLPGRGAAVLLNRGNRRSVAGAVQLCGAAPGAVVADIGFGGGVGLSMLLERVGDHGVVHGIEISPEMLDRAKRRHAGHVDAGRLRLAEGSLTALPLDDSCLDAAITVNTVYFVPELDRALAELIRVVRPGGRLLVGIGDPDAMSRMPFTSYGFTLRAVTDVVAAMESAGFEIIEQRLLDLAIPQHLLVAGR